MIIGESIAHLVEDRSTLQLGIGNIPDAVLTCLTHRKELRIWTEMFSNSVLPLVHKGAIHPKVPIVASFVLGSRELYDWMHRNRNVRMLRTEKTNDPAQIARQLRMTSINAGVCLLLALREHDVTRLCALAGRHHAPILDA